jgi:hypothetical protein
MSEVEKVEGAEPSVLQALGDAGSEAHDQLGMPGGQGVEGLAIDPHQQAVANGTGTGTAGRMGQQPDLADAFARDHLAEQLRRVARRGFAPDLQLPAQEKVQTFPRVTLMEQPLPTRELLGHHGIEQGFLGRRVRAEICFQHAAPVGVQSIWPLSPITRSAPLPALTVSEPTPASTTLSPSPTLMRSSPPVALLVSVVRACSSSVVPAVYVTSPLSPSTMSDPLPVMITSLPNPPTTMLAPSPTSIRSSPPNPGWVEPKAVICPAISQVTNPLSPITMSWPLLVTPTGSVLPGRAG